MTGAPNCRAIASVYLDFGRMSHKMKRQVIPGAEAAKKPKIEYETSAPKTKFFKGNLEVARRKLQTRIKEQL